MEIGVAYVAQPIVVQYALVDSAYALLHAHRTGPTEMQTPPLPQPKVVSWFQFTPPLKGVIIREPTEIQRTPALVPAGKGKEIMVDEHVPVYSNFLKVLNGLTPFLKETRKW